MAGAAGYSGKTLASKLGVKDETALKVIGAPPHYESLIAPLPPEAGFVDVIESADIVHLFVASRAELEAQTDGLVPRLKTGAALWVSWPKKTSPAFVDLTEDGVRAAVLPTGLVDVKVCAVDADWSALKFLRRKRQDKRPGHRRSP